jgi:hypothetical protein
MILTKPVIFQEGVDKATNQPVISITAPDAPDPIDGQPCGASLVFADVQALRHFARRLLATAYAIAHGRFIDEPVPGEHKPVPVSCYTQPLDNQNQEAPLGSMLDTPHA